jgi:glycerate dehydrogenase
MQHTIVFLDRDTVGAQLRQPNFPQSYQEYAVTPADCIVERLKDATIAILNKGQCARRRSRNSRNSN